MKESTRDTFFIIVILLVCLFGLITINKHITDFKKLVDHAEEIEEEEEEDCNSTCMSKIQFEIEELTEELTEELENCYQELRDNEI